MADSSATLSCAGSNATRFKEAVSIEAARIFDSCSDRESPADLPVFLTAAGQEVVNQSGLVKFKSAEVLDVFLSVEAMPFNRGFFTVDLTMYFRTHFSCYASPVSTPSNVRGLASHSRRVILFGGDGGVKTFLSDAQGVSADELPVAGIKLVEPVTLGSRVVDTLPADAESPGGVPDSVAAFFDAPIITEPCCGKYLLVTLGLFSIVTLQRQVQIMVPSYDYVLPEKECGAAVTIDDPIELFRRLRFPVQQFFPDNANSGACDCD